MRGGQPPGTSIYVLLPGNSHDTARGSRTTGGQRRQWVKASNDRPEVWGCAEESLSGFSAHPGTVKTRNFVVEVSELPELRDEPVAT